jgi:hypothetical protein
VRNNRPSFSFMERAGIGNQPLSSLVGERTAFATLRQRSNNPASRK